MEENTHKKLGMKWFKFFTKIRAWLGVAIGVLFAFSTIVQLVDYFEYGSFNKWVALTIVQIICYVVSALFCLMLVIKTDNYKKSILSGEKLFTYIKILLIFEVSYMEFSWILNKYYEGAEIDLIVITSIMCFLMEYFIWYRLNIKYFKRRLVSVDMITDENKTSYRIADDEYKSKSYGNQYYAKDMIIQPVENSVSYTTIQQEKSVEIQNQTITEKSTTVKTRYCSRCGEKLDNDTKKCNGCGRQYFKGFKKNKIMIFTLILLLILSGILNVYLYTMVQELDKSDELTKLQSEFISLENKNSKLKSENNKLKNEVSSLEGELDVCYQEIHFIDEYVVFVEDDGTDLYHKYQCHKFVGNYFWAFNVDAAKNNGYSACPLCCE